MFKIVVHAASALFLATATLIVGISMSLTNIDLNKAGKATGTVSSAELTPNKNNGSNLTIKLLGDEREYSLYRSSQEYQSIRALLHTGTPITIYYSQSRTLSVNYEIYQINTAIGIAYSKEEHERRERIAGRFIAVPGGILLLVMGYLNVRKRYRTLKDKTLTNAAL